jgi:hypothetical protein
VTDRQTEEIHAIAFRAELEALRQLRIWGEQNHPNFLSYPEHVNVPISRALDYGVLTEDQAKRNCEFAFEFGKGTYAHIFVEEVCEAIGAMDEESLVGELIQVQAVCINWIRAIHRRRNVDVISTRNI